MDQAFSRTALLLGAEAMEKLHKARVIVFGLGGVGGHACEALVRSGVGAIDLVDDDQVSESNLNRQLFATRSTIGMDKTEAAKLRLLDINPDLKITTHKCFFLPETADRFDFTQYDYIVDAIDTVTGKIGLVMEAQKAGVPIICSMGTGNKLDPSALRVADIYQTSVCPLARVMRRELKKRGVEALKVVYSRETPVEPYSNSPAFAGMPASEKNTVPGSTAFVPAAAGLILAGQVVRDLTGV